MTIRDDVAATRQRMTHPSHVNGLVRQFLCGVARRSALASGSRSVLLEQAVPGIEIEQLIPEPIVAPLDVAKRKDSADGPSLPHRHKVGEVVAHCC
jgi:hypothetical protein